MITIVQQTTLSYGAAVSSLNEAFGSPVTAGNTIIVLVFANASGQGGVTVSDATNGNYTLDVALDALGDTTAATLTGNFAGVWRFTNSGGASITVNLAIGGGKTFTGSFVAMEVSGLAATSPVDTTSTHHGLSGSPSTGTFSTSNANDLIAAVGMGSNGSNITITEPSGFTSIGQYATGATHNQVGDCCYEIVSSTQSSIDPAWTHSISSSNPTGAVAAYKASTGPSTGELAAAAGSTATICASAAAAAISAGMCDVVGY